MSKVMIILHSKDYSTGCKVFIDKKYMGVLADILDEILTNIMDEGVIQEEINLDSYLNKEERLLFYMKQNFFFTEEEQEAILEGDIDYAFDMIKERIRDE